MKAPILSFYEPEVQGRGTIMDGATPTLLKGCVNSDARRLIYESISWPNTQDRTMLFRRTENAGEPRL